MRAIDWRVHGALLFVQLTFGAFHVVGKGVLGHLSPLALAALRVAVSAPLLLALAWRLERVRPRGRDLPALAALGFLGVFANQILYVEGLERTTATNAGILMPSIPVFTLAIAAVAGIERLVPAKAAGVGLAAAGALVILDPARLRLGDTGTLGDLLVLLNCLAYAAYLVLQRPVLRRLPPLTVVAWAFLFGGAATFTVGLPALARTPFAAVPGAIWAGVAYIVVVPTAVNYALNSWALRRSSPALVASYTTLQPLMAGLLAVLFLDEALAGRQLLGFLLIAGGLTAVARRAGGAGTSGAAA